MKSIKASLHLTIQSVFCFPIFLLCGLVFIAVSVQSNAAAASPKLSPVMQPANGGAPSQTQIQNLPAQNQSPQSPGNAAKAAVTITGSGETEPAGTAVQGTEQDEFDGELAYEYLKTICAIGPRPSLSQGMLQQQQFLKDHFEPLGATIIMQPFNIRDPNSGQWVQLNNMVVRWNPERKQRLLFCCHYDTRPFPDRDKKNPRGVFIGANDGGSGVAVLCELGKFIEPMTGKYGVDFVFFDGEEYVFVAQRDPMFLGSTYFANQYAKQHFDWKYQFGILLDMVGDKDLQIHYEGNSLGYAPRLTRSIWGVAQALGVAEFVPKQRHKIRDDHLPLNQIARIETCDIIDFDYPNPANRNIYWHTQDDTVENCSADSLGKVGKVVLEWLRQMQRLNQGK